MRAPRLHVDTPLAEGVTVELPPSAAAHLTRVLRLQPGAALVLFDGHGGEFEATIAHAGRHGVRCRLGRRLSGVPEPSLQVTLVQGISRGERMDYTVQKAVELGVSAIAPVLTARSTVRLDPARAARRVRHWQAVVVAACEQCGRTRVPPVAPVATLDAALQDLRPRATRLMLRAGAGTALVEQSAPESDLILFAGPEGGLAPAEILAAEHAGFVAVRLGPRVLRTETAALAALAAIQALWGDLR